MKKTLLSGTLPLLAVILLSAWPQSAASAAAQGMTFTLQNASLQQIMRQVRQHSDLDFVASDADLSVAARRTVSFNNATVAQVLRRSLEGTGLDYTIDGSTIVIHRARQQPAQARRVGGRVTNEQGAPLAGAAVMVKGTQTGVSTDANGLYSIVMPAGGTTLTFSFMGMETQEVVVSTRIMLNVTLRQAVISESRVVVTGIFDRPEELYNGAARLITESELRDFKGSNLVQTIANIDPSVMILASNEFGSSPSHLPDLRIRGGNGMPAFGQVTTTANNAINRPLIVLDGFETSLEKLMDLDENEVQSITLLKDGSATSLYGSRGANGVIVVTTKQPIPGKLQFSYRGEINIEVPDLSQYDLLNAREKFDLENLAGLYTMGTTTPKTQIELEQYRSQILQNIIEGVDTYWLSKPLRLGVGQNHDIKAQGGDDSFRYSLSMQYRNVAGVMKGSNRNTINGGLNMQYINQKFTFRNNLLIGYNLNNESPYGTFDQYAVQNPYYRATDESGRIVKYLTPYNSNFGYSANSSSPRRVNPLWNQTTGWYDRSDYIDITNNFAVEWRPVEALLVSGSLGLYSQTTNHNIFKPADHTDFIDFTSPDDVKRKGSFDYTDGRVFNYTAQLKADFHKTFADRHMVVVGAGMEFRQGKSRSYTFRTEGYPDAELDTPNAGMQYPQNTSGTPMPGGGQNISRSMRLFANAIYSFDQRYTLDLSTSTDGSSASGVDNRFTPFGSVGLGWNLHNEKFIKGKVRWLDYMRLTTSYGVSGLPTISPYDVQRMYRVITNDNYNGWVGSQILGIGNPDLQLQQVRTFDVGFTADLFARRLNLVAHYYRENSDNVTSLHELPLSNGFASYVENVGATKKKGFDIAGNVVLVRDPERQLFWQMGTSIAHFDARYTKLSDALKKELAELEKQGGSSPNTIIREGDPTEALYVVKSLGIDPATGKELYVKKDGSVTYIWDSADRVYVGVQRPKYNGNITTMLRWREITLSASLGYFWGGVSYNNTLAQKVENAKLGQNVDRRVLTDRWQKPGDVAQFRGLTNFLLINYSSRFVQKERVLSLQNINLSYALRDQPWQNRLGLRSLTLTASTNNLFYLTTVKQERGTSYPFSRRFIFTAALQF